MTYRHIKKYLSEHNKANGGALPLRLCVQKSLARTVLIVGNAAPDVCAYLSSVLTSSGLVHSYYSSAEHVELMRRFMRCGVPTEPRLLEVHAGRVKRRLPADSSAECFLVSLALALPHIGEPLLICMSEELFERTCRDFQPQPRAVIICTKDRDRAVQLCSLIPSDVRVFTRASLPQVVRVGVNLLGTRVYIGKKEYMISSIEPEQAVLAALALECAGCLGGTTHALSYRGLSRAQPPNDARLYCATPPILLKVGERAEYLDPALHITQLTEGEDDVEFERALFYGNGEYIESIKYDIDHGKYGSNQYQK